MNNTAITKKTKNVLLFYNDIKYEILFGLICGSISSFIVSYNPLIYTKIVKVLLQETVINNKVINEYILTYIIYKISGNLFSGLRGYIFTKYTHILSINIKQHIFEKLLNRNIKYFIENDNSQQIDLYTIDTKKVADLYTLTINVTLRNLVNFIVISYLLIKKSFILYINCILIASIQIIIEEIYNTYYYNKSVKEITDIEIEEKNIISEYINNIETYKIDGLEKNLNLKINNMNDKYSKLKIKEAFYYGINLLLIGSLNNCLQCLLVFVALILKIEYKVIYEFTLYINEFANIIKGFQFAKHEFIRNKLHLERINKFLNNENKDEWGHYKYDYSSLCIPRIEFNNVTFYYENDNKYILKDTSIIFKPYKITGISGPSGIGKSSIFKLILGFYKPQSGNIYVDNNEIFNFNKEYYYLEIVSHVSQDNNLVKYVNNDNITHIEEIKMLAHTLIEDINNVENKTLSGGQKQRINIYNKLIKKTKILLLDEPTSGLDEKNEKKLLNILKKMSNKYYITVVIISHKKETLKICDNIVYLN